MTNDKDYGELKKPILNEDLAFTGYDEEYLEKVFKQMEGQTIDLDYVRTTFNEYPKALKTCDENGEPLPRDYSVLTPETTLAEFFMYHVLNEPGKTPSPWGISFAGYRWPEPIEGLETQYPFLTAATGYTIEETVFEDIGRAIESEASPELVRAYDNVEPDQMEAIIKVAIQAVVSRIADFGQGERE